MRRYIVFILVSITLFSCSKYQQLLKSSDMALKYEMAIKYYEKEEYYKAYPLLEELTTIYRGTNKAEKISYMLAYSDYYLEDYMLAAHRFKSYATTFASSTHAEECQYMSAYCYYLNSPNYSLDQSYTTRAINEMQLFINRFPQSNRIDTCNTLIDVMRDKLETKYFSIAKQYYRTKNYKSAIVAFKNVLKDYPDTQLRDEISFLIVKSNYLLAINSVASKKEERLQNTLDAYYDFIDKYEKSNFIKEAESIYNNTIKEKENLNQLIPKT